MANFVKRLAIVFILNVVTVFGGPFSTLAKQAAGSAKSAVTFAEVPAKVSGITWAHNNAHSPEHYLPETVGAGCAFFDYDNDGWMDIYLVNSGKCDFFDPSPPLRNALYRNNHDGTLQMSPRKPAFWVVDMGWE